MMRRVSRLLRSVARVLPMVGSREHVPDFHERRLRDAWSRYLGRDSAHGAGDGTWEKLIVSHFRDRAEPAFFFGLDELADRFCFLAAEQSFYRESIVNHALELSRRRLSVYAHDYAGLNVGFQWAELSRGPGDDILYQQRPHRFGCAPILAMASLWEREAFVALSTFVRSWMNVCAKPGSGAYSSNLVVIYRFLALHWTFVLLVSSPSAYREEAEALQFDILRILLEDSVYLNDHAGRSIANNHLLADGFALWYIGVQFPEFGFGESTKQRGEKIWLEELRRQIYEDGTSFEHSVHYHELACEMALVYLLLSRQNGYEVGGWVERRVRRMIAFQASCSGPHAFSHQLGDTTEDSLLPLEAGVGARSRSFIQIHEWMSSLTHNVAESAPLGGRAFWLLPVRRGPSPTIEADAVDVDTKTESYPCGGYFFLTGDNETRMLFRTGPAPNEEVFGGHMHYDFQTVYLSVGSDPVLVEAGTYTYRLAAKMDRAATPWRAHFLGPFAHNGLALDAPDPLGNVSGDFRNFEQTARVRSRWNRVSDVLEWVEGVVEDAGKYSGHRRGVVGIPGEYFVVYDVLDQAQLDLSPRFGFQLASGSTWQKMPDESLLWRNGKARLDVALPWDLVRLEILDGDPAGGWTSTGYGFVTAAPALRFALKPSVDAMAFVLIPHGSTERPAVTVERVQEKLVIRVVYSSHTDRLIVPTSESDRSVGIENMEVQGDVFWTRESASGPSQLRALGLSRFVNHRMTLMSRDANVLEAVHVVYDERGVVVAAGREERLSVKPSTDGV